MNQRLKTAFLLRWGVLLLLPLMAMVPSFLTAQEQTQQVVVAGKEYDRSGLYTFWFGKDYRETWTTPILVPVLELATEAGGLTIVRQVGGMQTPSLALKGADGRSYTFRSVNKDASRMLPVEWREAAAASIIQDQTAASYPGVSAFVDGLMEALEFVGMPPQRLVVMPDDPALGKYREAFAGLLGTFGEYPMPAQNGIPGFRGATEILSTKELWSRWLEDPAYKADSRALLQFRTIDIWDGNWDRHSKQWRWAKIPGREYFQPIPEDPDQIFSNYGGLMLKYARWQYPKFLRFKDKISNIEGVSFNGSDIDRWALTDLEKEEFIQIAGETASLLTDKVIDQALDNLPPEWYAIEGESFSARLKARRDNLMKGMERYYNHLAAQVDINCTDRDDFAQITRFEDGSVEITVALDHDGAEPYYRRRFDPKETNQVRLYLWGGNNRVVSEGPPSRKIRVQVIGGPGDDSLDDGKSGRTRFYDFEGDNTVVRGKRTKFDQRAWENPQPSEDNPWRPARDYRSWTHPEALVWWDGDLGFLLGAGFNRTSWSFRKFPYDNLQRAMLAYSTERSRFAFNYSGSFRKLSSGLSTEAKLRISGIDALNFYGFGNETEKIDEFDERDFYRVRENIIRFTPTIKWEPSQKSELVFGPEFQSTDETSTDTLISIEQPYGSGEFDQIGLIFGFKWDSLGERGDHAASHVNLVTLPEGEDLAKFRRRTGFKIEGELSYFPEILDVVDDFGAFEGVATGYLGLGKKEHFVLAGRAGGRRVRGTFPWHESAFIGGPENNRGFSRQRFAGEDSLYGGAEIRVHLLRGVFIFPGRIWGFLLADAGRVWVDGEDSTEWHPSYGGGLVVELAATPIKFWTGVARNDDEGDLRFYFNSGFAF